MKEQTVDKQANLQANTNLTPDRKALQACDFDQNAADCDKRHAKFAPLFDALYLLVRQVLSELPANARILCVGVGTGTELVALAEAFPQWRFTAVEPSAPVLNACHQRKQKHSGIVQWDRH
jgi:tRNA (cmo5U34)-methyltransferase